MAVECDIGSSVLEGAGLYPTHPGGFRDAGYVGRNIRPVLSRVAGELDIAVIRPHPDLPGRQRRFADRVDRGMHFRSRVVDCDTAGLLLLLFQRVVGRQIWRNPLPGLTAVTRAEQELRTD